MILNPRFVCFVLFLVCFEAFIAHLPRADGLPARNGQQPMIDLDRLHQSSDDDIADSDDWSQEATLNFEESNEASSTHDLIPAFSDDEISAGERRGDDSDTSSEFVPDMPTITDGQMQSNEFGAFTTRVHFSDDDDDDDNDEQYNYLTGATAIGPNRPHPPQSIMASQREPWLSARNSLLFLIVAVLSLCSGLMGIFAGRSVGSIADTLRIGGTSIPSNLWNRVFSIYGGSFGLRYFLHATSFVVSMHGRMTDGQKRLQATVAGILELVTGAMSALMIGLISGNDGSLLTMGAAMSSLDAALTSLQHFHLTNAIFNGVQIPDNLIPSLSGFFNIVLWHQLLLQQFPESFKQAPIQLSVMCALVAICHTGLMQKFRSVLKNSKACIRDEQQIGDTFQPINTPIPEELHRELMTRLFLEKDDTCTICLERLVDDKKRALSVFRRCGHVVHEECSRRLHQCPLCQTAPPR